MNRLNYQNYSNYAGAYTDKNIYYNNYYGTNLSGVNNLYKIQQPINTINSNRSYHGSYASNNLNNLSNSCNLSSSYRSSTDSSNYGKIPKHRKSEKKQVKFNNDVKVFEVQSFKTYNKIDDGEIGNQNEYFGTDNYKANLKKDCVKCNGCLII